MFASKTLRTLALAAALMSPIVAGIAFAADVPIDAIGAAHARGGYKGPAAFGAWEQPNGRTPLASNNATQGSNQTSLEQSGATGGGGQHS
jgi:hypothetical protein